MTDEFDFERGWLSKFSRCLDEMVGEDLRERIMTRDDGLNAHSDQQEVINWTQQAMERLDANVDEHTRKSIMTGCACHYPKDELQEAKKLYENSGDVDAVLRLLQEKFEAFLRDTLELDDALLQEVVARRWGLAGTRRGNTIVAIKIPKSGFLVPYLKEPDPEKRKGYYCHCPRVRDLVKTSQTMSVTYCYCGAGFYQGIWEEILGEPVDVEVLESVLQGDDVCKIAIHLPENREYP